MARRRRHIQSMQSYEIVFRAKKSLPLVARRIVRVILEHAVARTQRDRKLYLCHDIWNGSHTHLIVLTKDSAMCTKFYMEVQKKITDCLKALFGIDSLSIWEGRPTVMFIADLQTATRRISYLYANPAQDDQETCIERFPGLSGFTDFMALKNGKIKESRSRKVPRLRLPTFPVISTNPTLNQESRALRLLKKRNKEKETFERHPNIWMMAFGVREDEVEEINSKILTRLRHREKAAARLREFLGKTVVGSAALVKEEILKPHTPKKKERKLFYLGSCNLARIVYLVFYEKYCKECERCYQEWLKGNYSVVWPPGAFRPPSPPNMNVFDFP